MKTVTRIGKIARLPLVVREELNRRLADGEAGKGLVAWLNGLPEVRAIVAAEFGGKPVREQNLSEWKKGGYRDWVNRQELLALAPRLGEEAAELAAKNAQPVSDVLALWVTARYALAARRLSDCEGAEGLKLLRGLGADLAELRRGDHRAAQLALDRERLALEVGQRERGMVGQMESELIRVNPTDEGDSQGFCREGASPVLGNRSGCPTMTSQTAALEPRSQGGAERVAPAASGESDSIRLNPSDERGEPERLEAAGGDGHAARHAMQLPRQVRYQSPTLVTRAEGDRKARCRATAPVAPARRSARPTIATGDSGDEAVIPVAGDECPLRDIPLADTPAMRSESSLPRAFPGATRERGRGEGAAALPLNTQRSTFNPFAAGCGGGIGVT